MTNRYDFAKPNSSCGSCVIFNFVYKDFGDCFNDESGADCQSDFPIGQWVSMKMAMFQGLFTISVNGVEKHSTDERVEPAERANVELFVGTPYDFTEDVVDGIVQNIKLESSEYS